MGKQDVVARLVSQKCSTTLEKLLEQAFDAGRDFERQQIHTAVSGPLRELTSGLREAQATLTAVLGQIPKA